MPNLIIVRGPVGAGKTTTMHALQQELPDHTALEIDALKRMINPHERSAWRRDIAERASLFMASELLLAGRSVITETHTRWPEQARSFASIANQNPDINFYSFLVTAPLAVCIERAKARQLPDISYPIDESLVAAYYTNLTPLPGELTVHTDVVSPQVAARHIAQSILQLDNVRRTGNTNDGSQES